MSHRILHIIPSLDRAGAEKQLVLLCRGLSRDEFDVHVCALTRGGPREAELRDADVPVTVIGKRWKADPQSYWKLRRHIARLQPELVHTWLFAANAYGRVAARSAGVKTIVASERCVDRWKSWHAWAIDRRLARHTQRIVVNSPGVRDFCTAHGIPAEKFVVIPGGVARYDADRAPREALLAELRLPHDVRLIGAVGRLRPQKRLKDLIWAMELVNLLDSQVHLLIVGDGPQRRSLERFAHLLDYGSHVHFLGERPDVPRIMAHLDVLWLGSDYDDLPNSIMEAMAAGVPVVATDILGNRDLITSDETGFLVPVNGRADRVRATDKLFRDPDLAKRMAAAAQKRVLRDFGIDRMIDRHVQLYRELLGTRRER